MPEPMLSKLRPLLQSRQPTPGMSDEDLLNSLLDRTAAAQNPMPGPGTPIDGTPPDAPVAPPQAPPKPKAKAPKKAATPAAPQATPGTQPQAAGLPGASPGTYELPYDETLSEDQKKAIATSQRAYLLDPGLVQSRMDAFSKIPDVAKQKQGIDDYRKLIAMDASQAPQADLSGLMGLADVMSDGKYNLQSKYKAPASKAKELLSNMDKAQDDQRDYMKNLVSLANSSKAGMDTNVTQSILMQKLLDGIKTAKPNAPRTGNPINNSDKWNKNTRADLAGDDKNAVELGSILNEVKAGNPIDDNRISTLRAKADAGGRPNIVEVKQDAGSRALVDRAENAWSFLTTGNLSEKNRDLITKSLYDLAEYRQASRNFKLDRARQQGKQQYGQSDAQINSSLTPDYVNAYPKRSAEDAAKAAAPTNSRDKQLNDVMKQIEELKKLKGS